MAFELGQIEVRPDAGGDGRSGADREVGRDVEECTGDRFAVDQDVLFHEVPATRPDDQRGDLITQCIVLAVRVGEIEGALQRRQQIDLPGDHVVERRSVAVLEVGHEHFCTGVERVNDGLAVGRSGEFDPAIDEAGGGRRYRPRTLANLPGLGEKVGDGTVRERHCTLRTSVHQLSAYRLEFAV
jgi:hypothetical protein